ncbi:hypothetical protein [Lactiplantibacillus plantarum]|uniref:hypothetical protein n=1 Tax=Lactiplantibacillus plantarum TaxID=1590 RepID=UPI0025729F44|nr:hypothetical protein [Lactiplantibacillus plantarum]BEI53940.1 prophage protein [Lactiplantibacillus plantarum]
MTNYLGYIKDHNGNVIYPYTKAAAILDLFNVVVAKTGDQLDIRGRKDFNDGLTINGKQVLLTDDDFKMVASIPGNDIHNINRSGLYHYGGQEKNLPLMNGLNTNGYLVAVFANPDHGILLFIGNLTYTEKYQGKWLPPHATMPVNLWQGAAKMGDTMHLRAPINEFDDLQFVVGTTLGKTCLRASSIASGTRYVTQVGQTGDGKNTRSVELTLHPSSDGRSLTIAQVLFNASPGNSAPVKDAVLQRIEGIRG